MSASGQPGRMVQLGSLYALLLLLPFSKAAIELAFAAWLLGWLWERRDPQTRRHTVWAGRAGRPLLIAAGAFLGACALSLTASRHLPESLEGLVGKWLQYLLFMVLAADVGARVGVVRRAAAVIAAGSLLVIVEGVWQELFGRGLFRGYRWLVYGRMTGPYENPIDLATYLMVIIPLLLGWAAVESRHRARISRWALTAGLLLCLGRTIAFGAWLSFLLALGWMAWRGGPLRSAALAVICATALLGAAFIGINSNWRLLTLSDVGTQDRVYMWQAALGMIRDRPVLGHGVNTFMANYLDYWVGGERMPRYAHNCYLQVAAETGALGLAAFLAVLALIGRRIIRALRGLREGGEERLLLMGLAAGLLAFVVQAGYDTNFFAMRQAALFWVLAGLAVGLSARVDRPEAG